MYNEIKQIMLNEATKWKKLAADNKLSAAAIKKIKDAGIAKPIKEYISGISRGSHNIAKKHGINRYDKSIHVKGHPTTLRAGGAVLGDVYIDNRSPESKLLLKNVKIKGNKNKKTAERFTAAIMNRHETLEAKHKHNPTVKHSTGGQHKYGVLKDEKGITNTAKNVYGYDNKILDKQRKIEHKELESADKQIKKTIKKLKKDNYYPANSVIDGKTGRVKQNIFLSPYQNTAEERELFAKNFKDAINDHTQHQKRPKVKTSKTMDTYETVRDSLKSIKKQDVKTPTKEEMLKNNKIEKGIKYGSAGAGALAVTAAGKLIHSKIKKKKKNKEETE